MYNKAILIGRLTADPELRTTQNGISVTSFTIAVNRRFKNQNGEYETDFLNIVAWRQTAEFICKYFTKGRPILIDGEIQTREYTDKEGNNRRVWEVVADQVSFTESKSSAAQASTQPEQSKAQPAKQADSTDDFAEISDNGDLPF